MRHPAQLRERAAECRALTRTDTSNDAAEWLRLADKWDTLADRVEAGAARDALELPPPRPLLPHDDGDHYSCSVHLRRASRLPSPVFRPRPSTASQRERRRG